MQPTHFSSPKQVSMMVTCLVDTLFPQIGEAMVKVLRKAGCEVHFPAGQTCCGQPAFNAGLRAEARQMAERTIAIFETAPGSIIIPSGSCASMIRHGYPALFADDHNNSENSWLKRARAIANRTFEFSEYLVDILHQVDFGAVFAGPVTYHASCHLLRGLGVEHQPIQLLKAVRDARFPGQNVPLELVDMPDFDDCCGFGGVFSVEHAQLSAAMLNRKLNNIQSTGAPIVVCCDAGCLANMAGGLVFRHGGEQQKAVRVMHLAEVLASGFSP